MNFRVNFAQSFFVQWSMQAAEQIDSVTCEFLLRLYRAAFTKDPTSRATESPLTVRVPSLLDTTTP